MRGFSLLHVLRSDQELIRLATSVATSDRFCHPVRQIRAHSRRRAAEVSQVLGLPRRRSASRSPADTWRPTPRPLL
jgi:hypothetical protein